MPEFSCHDLSNSYVQESACDKRNESDD
jgi:hypothetical protein